ncbi:MFS transporter [Amycolatopsis acidiphila]|uniref:MFS transporter n=2 Tax=Amycolatopsis acidiphila TaxID=715473 RepID=A0A558A305_9PSEU|nr:MFS transporter [Amycolatopsis acidiphila]
MENLDGTIIATAAPRMAASFGVPSVDISAAMTAYLVTLAVGIPASGWLASRFGTRAVFGSAIVIFTVASGLCAASVSLPMLIGMRVLQGLGGAMMVPVGRLAVLRSTDRRDLIRAIAYLTWPGLIAPVLAPVLGGFFTQYASWRWIFLVNLPLGVLAGLLAARMVPAARAGVESTLDWLGFLLTGVSLAALVLGMHWVGQSPVHWGGVVAALAVGAGTGLLAVRHLRRGAQPLMDLRTLRVRTYRIATAGGSAYRAVITAVPFLLPLLFQDAFGWDPVHSGLVVIAVFAGNVGIKPFTTPIMRRFPFRPVLLASLAGGVATLVGCALLTTATPLWLILAVLFVSGVFRSIGFTAYNTLQFADVGKAELPSANTLAATSQQLAAGLGVALGALALRVGVPIAGDAGTGAYRVAFVILAAAMAACALEVVRLPAGAGDQVRAGSR